MPYALIYMYCLRQGGTRQCRDTPRSKTAAYMPKDGWSKRRVPSEVRWHRALPLSLRIEAQDIVGATISVRATVQGG